ncbi:MAG TPA: methyltransferase domain-containing protein [Acidimicrobiales bacterium]|nr:methyltransferase domain-containing protein [Acidimicrobiales bacterium]
MPETENVAARRGTLRPAATDRPPASCRLCGDSDFTLYLSIPEVAPSGQFIAASTDDPIVDPVSLSLWQCVRCGLVQHDGGYPENYYDAYFISYQASVLARNYQNDLAQEFVDKYHLRTNLVAEIGCGDGMFLSALREAGARVVGFERSHRAAEILRLEGHTMIETDLAVAAPELAEPLAAVATRHVLEHIDDLTGFLNELRDAIAPGGALLIEVPALEQTIEGQRVYDFIPEHLSYFSTGTLALALERAGFRSIEVRRIVGGEFLVATATIPSGSARPADWLGKTASSVRLFLADQGAAGRSVALWGAGPKGLGLVNEIDGVGIACVVDSDPLKYGRYTPTPHLPIVSPEAFIEDPSDVVVITAWAYREEIARQLADLGYGGEVLWLGPLGVSAVGVPAPEG